MVGFVAFRDLLLRGLQGKTIIMRINERDLQDGSNQRQDENLLGKRSLLWAWHSEEFCSAVWLTMNEWMNV